MGQREGTGWFRQVEWHETLPSTNAYLANRLGQKPELESGTLVAARCQTTGRGRHSRAWVSCPGRDLSFSFLVRTEAPAEWVPALPMAVALGVADALERFGVAARVKWPNDVLVNGRKICGLLSEYVPEASAERRTAVVGVGVNVNMSGDEAADIDRPATSILAETDAEADVDTVLDAVLDALPAWLDRWQAAGFAGFRDAWIARTEGLGQPVTVTEGTTQKHGVLRGFGEFGELILEDAAGHTRTILLGDVVVPGQEPARE